METLAVPVKDAARTLGIGRTKLYELIGAGQLQTMQIGRRRLVKLPASARWWQRLRDRRWHHAKGTRALLSGKAARLAPSGFR
ncbi:helix-turn-helix domain-containing protein [Sphingomonas sp. WKB10]|nr:helix-turn-helix domain-containing protein [Sphingomonas sp. WKB10]